MVNCWVPRPQSLSSYPYKLFIAQGSVCSSSILWPWKFCGFGTLGRELAKCQKCFFPTLDTSPKLDYLKPLCLSSFTLPLFTFPLLSSSQVCLIYRSPFPILLSCSGLNAHSVLLRILAHLFYILETVLSSKFCLKLSRPNSRWKVARENQKKNQSKN